MALVDSEFVYKEDGLELHFTSDFNLRFFNAMYSDTIKQFERTLNLTVQHSVTIDNKYPLLLLYYRIQRDNFYAILNNAVYKSFSSIPTVKIGL